ncbi:MAG: hypothetical protein JRH07_00390 [Deltaproteobacteria bacterium]|nr:hypothetical protein [Deltaproteobacteria bacterium]MBW2120292.1 hypothetical protein [Deltaproteobacteria bacterium]
MKGRLALTGDLLEKLETCLVCKTCVVNCPAHVPVDKIVMAARADYSANKGLRLTERLIFQCLLPRRRLFGLLVRLASNVQRLLPKSDLDGKIRHLPEFMSGLRRGRNIPLVADTFLRSRLPETVAPPEGVEKRAVVGFFAGCSMDYIYPDVAVNTVLFLARQGVEVHFPKEQGCCGMGGSFSIYHPDLSERIAQKKVDGIAASGADFVVSACPGCLIQLNDILIKNGSPQRAVHIMSLFE